jgi:ABC-type transport system involved in cytochrome c biogenesis permease subunit
MIFRFFKILFFILTYSSLLFAKNDFNPNGLDQLLILDNGRLKPFDTFARNFLYQFSGKNKISGLTATQWLARVIFSPLESSDDKIFLVNNQEVLDAIGIEPQKRRRYSFNEIKKGYHKLIDLAHSIQNKDSKDCSAFENEVLRIAQNITDYMQLSSIFMFFMPYHEFNIDDSLACEYLGIDNKNSNNLSFYDVFLLSDKISNAAKESLKKEKSELKIFDMYMISLDRTIKKWENSSGEHPFHIIPVDSGGNLEWITPWDLMLRAKSNKDNLNLIKQLFEIRKSYLDKDEKTFSKAINNFNNSVKQKIKPPHVKIELIYNSIDPFFKSKILYLIASIISLLLFTVIKNRFIFFINIFLILLGFLFHSFGILSRIIILHRPPLATIYETFIFVSWLCVLMGMFLEFIQKRHLGLFIASLCGFFFLHLASKYNAGDSMGMVAAVLNSNFWLTTHIMTITLGYAGCIIAGIISHIYLIQKLFFKFSHIKLTSTFSTIYGFLCFGFLFTLIGTMLGGMWADQSWGRFWGWDPKENGALLIILWSAFSLHANSTKIIKETGFAICSIICFCLVMFAWIGINLLGIGMHSYGFTNTGKTFLFSFMIIESLFILLCVFVLLFINKINPKIFSKQ